MKKRILLVGASGQVAQAILPRLSEEYEVVGISSKDASLAHLCVAHITGNLLTEHERIFRDAFQSGPYDMIIWNVVRYFPMPVLKSSRAILHTEFDLGVALLLEMTKLYAEEAEPGKKHMVVISSRRAFTTFPGIWASYSIVKRAQVILFEYLAGENPGMRFTAIAPANIPRTPHDFLVEHFMQILRSEEPHVTHSIPQNPDEVVEDPES